MFLEQCRPSRHCGRHVHNEQISFVTLDILLGLPEMVIGDKLCTLPGEWPELACIAGFPQRHWQWEEEPWGLDSRKSMAYWEAARDHNQADSDTCIESSGACLRL